MTKAIMLNLYQNWSQDKKFFFSAQEMKTNTLEAPSLPRQLHPKVITYSAKARHIAIHANTYAPSTQRSLFHKTINKKLYKSHKTISKVNTTVINMFHKIIIAATEFLFCKTISKDTHINSQISSLQDHHNYQIP